MLNDMLPDFEGSKINACVDNIYRIWKENADKKSAQLVFCDLSTPKNDGTFSVYNDIRKKLIERGIPESEVKFIHEADTDMKKKELFQKTRKGYVGDLNFIIHILFVALFEQKNYNVRCGGALWSI